MPLGCSVEPFRLTKVDNLPVSRQSIRCQSAVGAVHAEVRVPWRVLVTSLLPSCELAPRRNVPLVEEHVASIIVGGRPLTASVTQKLIVSVNGRLRQKVGTRGLGVRLFLVAEQLVVLVCERYLHDLVGDPQECIVELLRLQ